MTMNPQILLRTACKIFGLYLFILAAFSMRDISFYLMSGGFRRDTEGELFMLFPFYLVLFNIVAGLFLIYKADWITGQLKAPTNGYIRITLEKTEIIEVVLIAISILAILHSIPEMLYRLVSYAYFNQYEPHERTRFWSDGNTSDMLFSIFKFVAGLFLLLNARHLARRLTRVGNREDARPL
jgi:hypothetical protein